MCTDQFILACEFSQVW